MFEDIGKAFCIALLDFYECNPVSRLPLSNYKNLGGVKGDLLRHNPIFISTKRAAEIEDEGRKKAVKQGKDIATAQKLH